MLHGSFVSAKDDDSAGLLEFNCLCIQIAVVAVDFTCKDPGSVLVDDEISEVYLTRYLYSQLTILTFVHETRAIKPTPFFFWFFSLSSRSSFVENDYPFHVVWKGLCLRLFFFERWVFVLKQLCLEVFNCKDPLHLPNHPHLLAFDTYLECPKALRQRQFHLSCFDCCWYPSSPIEGL